MDDNGKDIIDKLFFKNNDSTVDFRVWDALKQKMLWKSANTTFMKPVFHMEDASLWMFPTSMNQNVSEKLSFQHHLFLETWMI